MTGVLDIQTDGHLRVLRLNRPDRKNALNGELIEAIVTAVRAAAADDDVWAIAMTGNGDAFCSGLDLSGIDAEREDDGARGEPTDEERAQDHFALVMRYECEKPILVGVNGVAVGIGVSLAMSGDIRLASPSARFHPGYARVGASPDGGLTWTLPEAVGVEVVHVGDEAGAASGQRHVERRGQRGVVLLLDAGRAPLVEDLGE
jgi:2-(1,2-epoxy-1,2-dihydrophenyl)acetyl-CoA isomerase